MSSLHPSETSAPEEPLRPQGMEAAGWRRLDVRMLVVHPVRELARLLPLLIGVMFAGSSSGRSTLWGLVGAGIAIGLGVLRWFTTTYRIAGGQVQVQRGLLRRRLLSVPLDRVRTVDVSASALHRVLGLVRVSVGTGLSDRKSNDALRLDGLSVAEADRLRDLLLHRGGVEQAATAAPEEVIAAMQPSWVWYGPFTFSGFVTVFVVLGFAWRIVSEAQIDPRRLGPVTAATSELSMLPRWIEFLAALLVLLGVVAVASTVGYLLAFWNFHLVRNADGALQVTRGLVSTRATTIEERRLRGVELSEPLLLRAVRGARCIAIATGLRVGRGAERGGSLLLPPAPRQEARRVATAVLHSPEPVEAELVRHGPSAHRRRHTRVLMIWALVVVALVGLAWLVPALSWTWQASLVLLPVWLALAYDRYLNLGHALAGRTLVTRAGSLVRRRSMLACDGIIGWNLRQSFFQRRAGLATVVATTAAGRQQYEVQDVGLAEAVRVADQALPGLLTPFLAPATGPSSISSAQVEIVLPGRDFLRRLR
ncbi:PH domain-containing protein [Candidatus Nephthysia bennettiae]